MVTYIPAINGPLLFIIRIGNNNILFFIFVFSNEGPYTSVKHSIFHSSYLLHVLSRHIQTPPPWSSFFSFSWQLNLHHPSVQIFLTHTIPSEPCLCCIWANLSTSNAHITCSFQILGPPRHLVTAMSLTCDQIGTPRTTASTARCRFRKKTTSWRCRSSCSIWRHFRSPLSVSALCRPLSCRPLILPCCQSVQCLHGTSIFPSETHVRDAVTARSIRYVLVLECKTDVICFNKI